MVADADTYRVKVAANAAAEARIVATSAERDSFAGGAPEGAAAGAARAGAPAEPSVPDRKH